MTATPSTSPLRAAVIGTGKISEEHLKFLGTSPHAVLAGVCDLSPSLAKFSAKKFRAQAAYTDHRRMLDELKVDVVHVLTPAASHLALATDAMNAGAHVLVEKPITLTNPEFRQLWQLSQDKGRRLVEDHNYRFNEPVLAIEQMLADGTLGEPREVEVRMVLALHKEGNRFSDELLPNPAHRLPAGVIHEFLTHMAYLTLRFLPGRTFQRARAIWGNYAQAPTFKYDDLDALVVGANGVHGRIRFSAQAGPDCFEVTVRGSKGWAQTDLFQPYLRTVHPRKGGQQLSPLINHWVNGRTLKRSAIVGFRNKVMQKSPYEGLHTLLDRVYSALRTGQEPPISFADMDETSRLVDALVAEENRI